MAKPAGAKVPGAAGQGASPALWRLLQAASEIVQAVRAYFAGHADVLPIIAIFLVGVGQWTNGGNYALASLIWMLAGVVAARAARLPRRSRPPVARASGSDEHPPGPSAARVPA